MSNLYTSSYNDPYASDFNSNNNHQPFLDNRNDRFEEFFSQVHRGSHPSWVHRLLKDAYEAKAKLSAKVDYSVLSVGVMTLGLIMIVEVLRHKVDHAAIGKPFFKAVLDGINSELATLGIVEFLLHVMAEYHEDYDKNKKQVFADVHFLLFYTALINAALTILLAFVTTRYSHKIWVETEMLELNHYVEIREEFEHVKEKLESMKRSRGNTPATNTTTVATTKANPDKENRVIDRRLSQTKHDGSSDSNESNNGSDVDQRELAEESLGFQSIYEALSDRIRYPKVKRKYNDLLLQIRFHELRIHFLQSYNLPMKLKISDYLIKSELHVLIHLSHISIVALLLLTVAINLCYFVFGIVSYKIQSNELIGELFMWIFFLGISGYVFMSFALWNKMKKVFRSIMLDNSLWDINNTEAEEKEILSQKQKDLFWFSEPHIVVIAIQFMQFGYSIALSSLIIYFEEINDGALHPGYYFLGLFSCYGIFLAVTSQAIPRFTLCTNLAQLVDEHTLEQTLAEYHLQEAKEKAEEEIAAQRYESEHYDEDAIVASHAAYTMSTTNTPAGDSSSREHDHDTTSVSVRSKGSGSNLRKPSQQLATIASRRVFTNESMGEDSDNSSFDPAALMASMVKSRNTESLRNILPESERQRLQERLNRKYKRKKMMSDDGVSRMRSSSRLGSRDDSSLNSSMRSFSQVTFDEGSGAFKSNSSGDAPPAMTAVGTSAAARGKNRRMNRMKSVSDGVALMAQVHEKDELFFGTTPSIAEESKIPEDEEVHQPAPPTTVSTSGLKPSISNLSLANMDTSENDKVIKENEATRGEDWTFSPFIETEGELQFGENLPTPEEQKKMREQLLKNVSEDVAVADADDNSSSSNHSNVDDVPDVDSYMLVSHEHTEKTQEPFMDRLRTFYLSKQSAVFSNIFGTMIAFFYVGQRVESFIMSEGIIQPDVISFDFAFRTSFWMLFAWNSLFFLTSGFALFCIGSFSKLTCNKERQMFVAAILDLINSSVCMAISCYAEAQRCCDPEKELLSSTYLYDLETEYNVEGGDEDYGSAKAEAAYDSTEYSPYGYPAGPHPCDCPTFGFRRYGGLGTIEPWTCLICLRSLRFWVAKKIVVALDSSMGWTEKEKKKHESHDDEHGHGHGDHGHGHDDHGHDDHGHGHGDGNLSPAELWQKAMKEHPEIVKKYGQFSGELLQVMLGIPVVEKKKKKVVSGSQSVTTIDSRGSVPRATAEMRTVKVDKEYQGLSPTAQGVIVAGKYGRSATRISSALDSINESGEKASGGVDANSVPVRHTFELSAAVPSNEHDMFAHPNARLVRNMRRCDRKLLPILDKWSVVDVVMTRYEIVYFAAGDVDEKMMGADAEGTREAIAATKGGTGLRLCDVAKGRKVVGHLAIPEIASVHVTRFLPSADENVVMPLEDNPDVEVERNEFWLQSHTHNAAGPSRCSEWWKIKQDVLKIGTIHGRTICLRFYADLEDAQHNPTRLSEENEMNGMIYKNTAFHWAQTIGRFCGPERLKQRLPHFGDDTSEELRDYLIIQQRLAPLGQEKSFFHRRRDSNAINMADLHHPTPTPVAAGETVITVKEHDDGASQTSSVRFVV